MILSKDDIFKQFAPSFNFEHDAEQLVEIALERGFVTKVGDDEYLVNDSY